MSASGGKAAADRAALLEEFAEACTIVARGLAPVGSAIDWEAGKDGFVHFHCPLPGLRAPHGWNGAPRASAWVKEGTVQTHCAKCVGTKNDYQDTAAYEAARAAYTEQVKRAIRWEQDGVVHVGFKTTLLRSHVYFDRDFHHAVRRDKVRYEDGRRERGNRDPWRWRVAVLGPDGKPGPYAPMRAEPWLKATYPEHDTLYDALCWYGIELVFEPAAGVVPTASTIPLRSCRIAITEGEKDAETFNDLMRLAGRSDIVATCLCHPKPTKLASHHARLLDGREVIVIGDMDEPGRQHAENWAVLAWEHASSVKLVREQLGLAGTPEDKDLTDWVVKRGGQRWRDYPHVAKAIADELIDLFASTAPLLEPPGRPTEWRTNMIEAKGGMPKADSPHNAERVWTMHPALKGRVRTNLHSGEVEVVDPPWGGGTTIGARNAAALCSMWLERTEKMSLSTKVLEEVVRQEPIAPLVNIMPQPEQWDGTPALGRMVVDVPLDASPDQALRLWEVLFADLVAKLAGERRSQRFVLGIATERNIDFAHAIMGERGAVHGGSVSETNLLDYARRGIMLVQVGMNAIADQRRSLTGMAHIMAPDVWNRSLGRALPTPLMIAVGPWPADPRSLAKVGEGCLILRLAGEPLLDALTVDAQAALAEAAARRDSIDRSSLPDQTTLLTVDEAERRKTVKQMLWAVYQYAIKALPLERTLDPHLIASAPVRNEPLRYVIREQMLNVMQATLINEWRSPSQQAAAFNAMCRGMGWRNKVSVTPKIAGELGLTFDFTDHHHINVPGTTVDRDRLKALSAYLEFDDDLPPTGGGNGNGNGCQPPESESPSSPNCPPQEKASNPAGSPVPLEAFVRVSSLNPIIASYACAQPRILSQDKGTSRWLVGAEAVAAVKTILAQPGLAAIDFETYPTAVRWHGDEAAAHAPRVGKAKAREEAVLNAQMGRRAHQRQACTMQLHHETGAEVFVRLTDPSAELPAMFEGRVASLVAHNAQFETELLLKHGIAADVDCTMLAAKALYLTAVGDDQQQPVSFSLAALVEKEFGRTRDKTIRDRDWRLEASLDDEAVEYGLADVRDCLALWQLYSAKLEQDGLLGGYRVMQRSILATAACNLRGLCLDDAAHAALMQRMTEEAARLEAELDAIAVGQLDNHGSSQQVSNWIVDQVLGQDAESVDHRQRLPRFVMRLQARTNGVVKGWRTTKTGHLAITKGSKLRKAEQLAAAFPRVSQYLVKHAQWTKATKLLDAFGPTLRRWQDEDGRVRGQFKVWQAWTGRQSAADPNLQNQPREAEFRALWVAPPGRKLLIADYDQVELRLLAIVTGDERLREVYREGRDVHAETAGLAFNVPREQMAADLVSDDPIVKARAKEQRRQAKAINFGIAYGAGAAGIAEAGGFELEQAREMLGRVLASYPGLAEFRERAPAEAAAQGYIAIRPGRRVLYTPESPGTCAINAPIQGGAASVQMLAMRLLHDALTARPDLDAFLCASVHDEFLVEAPDDERVQEVGAIMVDCMTKGLLTVFPEAGEQGLSRLTAATPCRAWSEKP